MLEENNCIQLSVEEGLSVIRKVTEAFARGESVYVGRFLLAGVIWSKNRLHGFIEDTVSIGRLTKNRSAIDPIDLFDSYSDPSLSLCQGVDITAHTIWAGDKQGGSVLIYAPDENGR